MKKLKEIFNGICFGLAVNSLVFGFIISSLNVEVLEISVMKYQRSLIASIVIGLVGALSGSIFANEKRSLLQSTIIHFLVIISTVMVAGSYAFWLDFSNIENIILFVGIFVVVYAIIYLTILFIEKQKVKEINNSINRK